MDIHTNLNVLDPITNKNGNIVSYENNLDCKAEK